MENLPKIKKYSLGDIAIYPKKTSEIQSRSECYVLNKIHNLPIFVAPMDTVVNEKNVSLFADLGLNVCMPRNSKGVDYLSSSLIFESLSMDEFIDFYSHTKPFSHKRYILVDIANGHMDKLLDICKKAKIKYGDNLVLMAGNVANPETIEAYIDAKVDYVRLGIGTGSACTTTNHTGIHYPLASLIYESYIVKHKLNSDIKLVADGGIRSTYDINLALALGADYVMVGGLFNQTLEACGQGYLGKLPVNKPIEKWLYKKGFNLKRKYRGMSTVEVQKSWGNWKLKRSEGIITKNPIKYELSDLVDNIKDRLKSCMSYCGVRTLDELNPDYVNFLVKSNYTTQKLIK